MRSLLTLTLAAGLLASGCAGLGHKTIRHERFDYNEALVRTWNEQMLLNLVRLKYRDTPLFLEISSIATQYQFQRSIAAGADLDFDGGNGYTAGTGLSYVESPTISYAPLQGEQFVTQLLSPIPLEAVVLLAGSGWSVDRVMRCTLQQASGVYNAPSASGPTPDYAPEFAEFQRLGRALRALQVVRAVDLGLRREGERAIVTLRLDPSRAPAEPLRELRELLELDSETWRVELTLERDTSDPARVPVVPRSLLGTMYFLSQAVEAPPSHAESGLVNATHDERGELFDWSDVTGDLFRVRSSDERPQGAFVAVRYRGAWFWIDDADLESKSTFGLLAQLFSLQAGRVNLTSPLLTLPI